MEKIGIIAGSKKFPIIFSQGAKKKGCFVVAVGIKGDTSPKLKRYVDKLYWISIRDFNSIVEIFKSEGIAKIAMAGQIHPRRLFSKELKRSEEAQNILNQLKDKKADTIFGAIAQKLEDAGLKLLDTTTFVKEYLPPKGVLTKTAPDFSAWEDIYFGFDIAKIIAHADIGQTVAVKNKAIVGVEALEGTDNLILRAGKIAGRGSTLVKVSKPKQDMRFDIPVVGLNTIKNLVNCKAKCLAIEADKTLFIDKEESIKMAERKGISIVAI
ncbi:MAG: hypothetical protein DRP74_01765 [Candidatus Omnitrophota bacterium]|nr:MAG: hypothetical protein DRP74_01765 [Candidatus Omnitrophota bacterium]